MWFHLTPFCLQSDHVELRFALNWIGNKNIQELIINTVFSGQSYVLKPERTFLSTEPLLGCLSSVNQKYIFSLEKGDFQEFTKICYVKDKQN